MNDSAPLQNPNELDPIETADRDEIAALQLARLRTTLRHVYDNVAHYRTQLDDAGLKPADLESLSDLAQFPFTVKEDLRRNYPFGMFAVPREQVMRIHASSGTTGTPTVVGYTANDLRVWAEVMARSMRAAGVRSGDMVQITYGYGLFTGGLGFHDGAERLGCTVVPVSGGLTARQVQIIDEFKPRMIAVTPSYLLAIADEFARQGLDPRRSRWRSHVRRRAVDRGDAQRDRSHLRHPGGRRLRAVRDHRPGRLRRVRGEQGRALPLGGPLLSQIIDPATGEVLPTARRASWSSPR